MIKYSKTILITIVTATSCLCANARLTLDDCQRLAQANYPIIKQYDLIKQTTAFSVANINKGYLPQISVSAQASYQSDVATLPEKLSDLLHTYGQQIDGLKKEQYKIGVDLSQTIWDGGLISSKKKVAKQEGEVKTRQTDVDMYAIRQRVNNLFFGILMLNEQIRINEELQRLLDANCSKLKICMSGGIAMQADVDAVRAEKLKAEQGMTELQSSKESFRKMLAVFLGKNKEDIVDLENPAAVDLCIETNKRPELSLFDSQLVLTEAQENVLKSNLLPRLSLFAQGFYGYPGYDMFSDMLKTSLSLNGMVGLKLSWNISSLYTNKNDKRILAMQKLQIESNRETFLFNNKLQSSEQAEFIERYKAMMTKDDEIIRLRKSVRQSEELNLEHGVVDVNSLLQEIIRENQACIERSSHEIEMLKYMYELKNTINQ